ncbi:MAG: hypothetical protein M1819_005658 [Sarea resinae]|nr:MAG: hypothetical protein M1819_005658 [Sarea resinae]
MSSTSENESNAMASPLDPTPEPQLSTNTSDSTPLGQDFIPATTASLDKLQNDEQRKVLDIVDSLRQCGLEEIVSLPQLVVCGDQSSGKSSVLEAITEIPFPRRENLCTRFATEIVLRRAANHSIRTRIIPEKSRPKHEQDKLELFRESISDFDELPGLIDKATKLMGIEEVIDGTRKAFAGDVLSIEISGPNRPQLTLVDLPGLIHSENKFANTEDIQLVSNLVEQYICNPRTIILAIVSAQNDHANQIILKRARMFDKKGSRTLGIITKPDGLHPGSGNESAYIGLAKNEDIFFALGWHVLRNRGFPERHDSFDQRNQSEKAFFSKGSWQKLSSDMLGIESLRVRLSDLLFQHIKWELPKLREELNRIHDETVRDLQALGKERSTVGQQKEYLMHLCLQFYDITRAGVNGHYESDYFDKVKRTRSFGFALHERRLRAMVQELNFRFAEAMGKAGHKYRIKGLACLEDDDADGDDEPPQVVEAMSEQGEADEDQADHDESNISSEDASEILTRLPKNLSRSDSLSWVKEILIRTRGRELPGNFNPLLIGELFWEQSENWRELAENHIEDVSRLCVNFVQDLLEEICPPDVCSRLQTSAIDESLRQRRLAGEDELVKLLKDRRRYPITYNHYYTTAIQKTRRKKHLPGLEQCLQSATRTRNIYPGRTSTFRLAEEVKEVDNEKFLRSFGEKLELDMDNHSCSDALDDLHAFYRVALKTFIDNVTVQVVERHIVDKLEDVFSPLTVSAWSDGEVSDLVAEPPTTVRQREYLNSRRRMLEDGKKVFRSVLRGHV